MSNKRLKRSSHKYEAFRRRHADVSISNPPEVNTQAVKAETEARKIQAKYGKLRSGRAAKQNAPEMNRAYESKKDYYREQARRRFG
tara:strand:- start:722 stop:979 length:258 start_codon:yes stop_codon:yes gene_type:complete